MNKQTRETGPTPCPYLSSPRLHHFPSAPRPPRNLETWTPLLTFSVERKETARQGERVRDCRDQFERYLLATPRRTVPSAGRAILLLLTPFQGVPLHTGRATTLIWIRSCSRFGRGWNRPVAGGDVRIRRGRRVRPLAAGAVHAGRAPIAQGQGDVRIRGLLLRSPLLLCT
jgi:hypothetical protein